MTCNQEDCSRPVRARGMCRMHYLRWHRAGGIETDGRMRAVTDEDRLRLYVDASGDCWYWTGKLDDRGYGIVTLPARRPVAHRWIWELLVGPISADLELDHLCRVHHCVNPDHLEPVTHAENVRRGLLGQLRPRYRTCPKGHTYELGKDAWPGCRECRLARTIANNQKRRANQ